MKIAMPGRGGGWWLGIYLVPKTLARWGYEKFWHDKPYYSFTMYRLSIQWWWR